MKIRFACGSILAATAVASSGIALAQQVNDNGDTHATVVWTVHGAAARNKLPGFIETLKREAAASADDALKVTALESLENLQKQALSSKQSVYTYTSSIEADSASDPRAAFVSSDIPVLGQTQTISSCVPMGNYAENTSISQVWSQTSSGAEEWVTYATRTWRTTSCPTTA